MTTNLPDPRTSESAFVRSARPTRRTVLQGVLLAGVGAWALPNASNAWAAPAGGSVATNIAALPRSVSGIYPMLTMFNDDGECGTGAVVPWAGSLWAITYSPHAVRGSSDKLYEITPELQQVIRPESVGGTNANRMIHEESNQLFIGPYAIADDASVRVISRTVMPGRLTGTSRHHADPANKVHFGTMEEGLYSVDVNTLEVSGHIKDGNGGITSPTNPATISSTLPGYHGKGMYTHENVVIYSNNGDAAPQAQVDPTTASGALAEWHGSGDWQLIRRNQFTEVTGPAGIVGGSRSADDPVWAMGWDYRSLILQVRQGDQWQTFRLPKSSHSYDGAHGWNTEWPRIREVGEGDDLLMTMHGAFWRFPAGFRIGNARGIRPRSSYLKVVGDFARWGDHIVMGADDTAKNEFYNKRRHKGNLIGPGQSQSNLWFVEPGRLDDFGFAIGRGSVWDDDDVPAATPSDPFLIAGFDRRVLHLSHQSAEPVTFDLEIDADGSGTFTRWQQVTVPANGYQWIPMPSNVSGEWMRLTTDRAATKVNAAFSMRQLDERTTSADAMFDGLAKIGDTAITGGLLRARGGGLKSLAFVVDRPSATGPQPVGYYEMDGNLELKKVEDPESDAYHRTNCAIPTGVLDIDAASVLVIDDAGRRWRLPKFHAAYEGAGPLGAERIDREICTERDLFNAHGTFYELPAENAGGFAKMRPVASHGRRIKDYCSYRGMVVITGVRDDAPAGEHIIRSTDDKTALWLGTVDDLWKLGRPRGVGGPWKNTAVVAGQPSDPYLMTAYEEKSIALSHQGQGAVDFDVQVDITGEGNWVTYRTFTVDRQLRHRFPEHFSAYWVRVIARSSVVATAQLTYS